MVSISTSSFWDELSEREIEVTDKSMFVDAVNYAILFFVRREDFNSISPKLSGWQSIDHGILYCLPASSNFALYQGAINSLPHQKLETFRKVQNYLNLTNLEITLPLLSYFLLSITFPLLFSDPSKTQWDKLSKATTPLYDLFGLCVSGRTENMTSKLMSNLFFNLIDRDPKRFNSIPHIHYPSVGSAHTKQRSIFDSLSDCPILIDSSSNPMHKDSKLVNLAMNRLLKFDNAPFPVFVTKTPFYRDDIITIDLSHSSVFETFNTMIQDNCEALAQFIDEFTLWLSVNSWKYYTDSFKAVYAFLFEEGRSDPNKIGKYQLLLYAYRVFLNYGLDHGYSSRQAQLKFDTAAEIFKKASLEDFLPMESSASDEPFGSFKAYVSALFNDDHEEDVYPPIFHHMRSELNPPNELCYYLDYYAYWDDFNRNYLLTMDQKSFETTLHKHSIIKAQNPTRFVLQRRFDGDSKPLNCLVVDKQQLDALDASKFLPSPHHKPIRKRSQSKKSATKK